MTKPRGGRERRRHRPCDGSTLGRPSNVECLDDNVLTAYLEHLLEPDARRAVEAHLDTCESCLAITCEVVRSAVAPVGTPAEASIDRPERGTTIGRYAIRELIGRGGMGTVYLAHDPQLDRLIALKVVRTAAFAAPEIRERLSRESRAMAKIRHANVVSVYDAGELDDGVFIAMELIDGVTLARWQAEARPWRDLVTTYLAVGRGLAAAHAAGVVHRDFKPDNVLVDREGRPAVTDFGLAVGTTDSGADALAGTPRYMSPEQRAKQPVDARSDQYSFAVALREALHGRAPPTTRGEGDDAGPGELAPSIPVSVDRVLERALRADREARFPAMQDLLDELARAASARPNRRWLGIAAVAALATAAVGVIALRGPAADERPTIPVVAPAGAKRITVLVPPFANTTGDPRLDDTLDGVVADVIYRSTKLEPLAGVELVRAAKTAGVTDPGALAPKLAGRTAVVVRGSVAREGDGFRVTFGGETRTAANADALLAATADLARAYRRTRGDDSTEDPPPSTSLDAMHEHAQASALAIAGEFRGAAAKLRHALVLDPHFVAARVTLGLVLYNLSDQKGAVSALEAAVNDADRLPERLRLQLLGDYYGTIGKYPEAISAFQRYLARWPGDPRTEINLIATAIDANDFPLAYELAKHTVVEHPDTDVVRANFILSELATGRWQDAVTDGTRMLAELSRPTDFGFAFVAMSQSLLGRRDDATRTWGRLAALSPEIATQGLADQAIYEGRLDDALVFIEPYIEIAAVFKAPLSARTQILMRAAIHLRRGERDQAAADAALVMDSGERRPDFIAASIAIDAGHLDGGDARAKAWQASDLVEWRVYGKLLEGDLALARGAPEAAVAAYRDAVRLAPLWVARARLLRGLVTTKAWADAQRELDWCQEHRGEAAVFLTPTLSYVRELETAREAILGK